MSDGSAAAQAIGNPGRALDVLYVHPIRSFGGASRSLMELLRGFPAGTVRPLVMVPRGQVGEMLEEQGYEIVPTAGIAQYDTTRFGHYRGPRWFILLREAAFVPATVWGAIRILMRRSEVDLIHANEVTALASALLMKVLLRRPLVVHVRSVQQVEGTPIRRWLLELLLRRHVDAVVAIDETVRASLPMGLQVNVVHNSFTPRLSWNAEPRAPASVLPGHGRSFRVAMVGSLLPLKGVREFLEAARICVADGVNADFVIVGANPRKLSGLRGRLLLWAGFAHDVEGEVDRFIAVHGLQDRVRRIGFVADVSSIYESVDVLCFPSYLDAVGRPVIEAAWFGVPSIVALDRPLPDTFIDGETGVCIPSRDAAAIAAVVARLSADREGVHRMGETAQRVARARFDSQKNALRILALYEAVTARHRGAAV